MNNGMYQQADNTIPSSDTTHRCNSDRKPCESTGHEAILSDQKTLGVISAAGMTIRVYASMALQQSASAKYLKAIHTMVTTISDIPAIVHSREVAVSEKS